MFFLASVGLLYPILLSRLDTNHIRPQYAFLSTSSLCFTCSLRGSHSSRSFGILLLNYGVTFSTVKKSLFNSRWYSTKTRHHTFRKTLDEHNDINLKEMLFSHATWYASDDLSIQFTVVYYFWTFQIIYKNVNTSLLNLIHAKLTINC